MNLLPLFQSLEATFVGTKVRESLWMFPVIECVHLLALAMLGGAVLAVDLRALGIGLRQQSVADLDDKMHSWMAWSVFMLIATGVPMFLSEAIKCYYSPPFWYKISILAIAVLFAFTIRRRVNRRATDVEGAGTGSFGVKLTAAASLALWFSVAFAGRWIAFY